MYLEVENGRVVSARGRAEMTEQIKDSFIYGNDCYEMVQHTGSAVFSPQDHGMVPEMIHTACRKGYYAEFEISNGVLYLRRLTIRDQNGRYCPLGGIGLIRAKVGQEVLPQNQRLKRTKLAGRTVYIADESVTAAVYSGLNLQVPFTGKMRLVKDHIDVLPYEYDLYMLFVSDAHCYRKILDFSVDRGVVVDVIERSEEMERKRTQYREALDDEVSIEEAVGRLFMVL